MIRRSMNPARVNELANHPEVRPWLLGADGQLDLTSLVMNPAVVVLEGEHGAFLLVPIGETTYELHTMWVPEGRGKPFFADAAEMFRYIFTRTPALEIATKVPDANRGAAVATAKTNFRERFHRAGMSFRALSIEDWALNDRIAALQGHMFHEGLEQAKEATGSTFPTHDDDPVHDHIVGGALLMAYAGNLEKGVNFYNEWAVFAGYAQVAIVGPNLVDIQDAIVEVHDGRVGVLHCLSVPHSQPLP